MNEFRRSKIQKIKKWLWWVKQFGIGYGLFMLALHFADGRSEKIVGYISKKIYPFIENYIYKRYKGIFEKWNSRNDGDGIKDDCPIFLFWWQGRDLAPPIVKVCVKTVKKYAEKHPVHLIDKNNVHDYIQIPDYMIKGVVAKRIELPNFSDWVRVSLLSKYGGYWLDASTIVFESIDNCFLVESGKNEEEKVHFWSIKTGLDPEWNANMGKWHISYLAAEQDSRLMGLLYEVMLAYYQEHQYSPLYLFMDCIVRAAYHHTNGMKHAIDAIPISNTDAYQLLQIINEPYDATFFSAKKGLAKINWKEDMREYERGMLTNYGYIMEKTVDDVE